MSIYRELFLPSTFEDIRNQLGRNDLSRMMDFYIPVEEIENEISYISRTITKSGKIVLIKGKPGVGKSTFIESLQWRTHILVQRICYINVSDSSYFSFTEPKLPKILQIISDYCRNHDITPNDKGVTTFVLDYLESIMNEKPNDIRSFFQNLNGILRNNPILILWPVTTNEDVDFIVNSASAVSNTLFPINKPSLEFNGPLYKFFTRIVKNTIFVLNPGSALQDFHLTEEDFEECLNEIIQQRQTLRDYLISIYLLWQNRINYLDQIKRSIPKPTEIWFVFAMPEAENLITQFARKSLYVEDCWDAYFNKFYEYIHGNQREKIWNANRLQLALNGIFKTKIIYLPTNALISCLAAYGQTDFTQFNIPARWGYKSTAQSFFNNSPLVKQLKGESVNFGNSRGGAVKESLETAREAFNYINAVIAKSNLVSGSDKPFNKEVAMCLEACLSDSFVIQHEKPHAWIPTIIPDISLENRDALICLEFHYTKQTNAYVVADYVLHKLDIYMRQAGFN